jgi:hypothetical protein
MRLKNRARRFASTLQSRPSTGMSPLIIPVDGDYPSPLAQHTTEELIRALARIFAPTDHPAVALKPVTDGEFAVLEAKMDQNETIRPSRDTVSRSLRGVRTCRPVGEWMKFR